MVKKQKTPNPPDREELGENNKPLNSLSKPFYDKNNGDATLFDNLLLDMEDNIEAVPDAVIADGTIHRFDVDAIDDKKGWYVAHSTEAMSYAFYGDWSEGQTYKWHSLKDTVITQAQSQRLKSAMLEAQKIRNEARALEQSEAAKECKEIWDSISDASDDHPYLKKKGVKAYGIRLHPKEL